MTQNFTSQSYQYLSEWDFAHFIPPIQVVSCFIQVEDQVLLLQRAKDDEQYLLWGIPGGKLDENENPSLGLVREVYEETKIILDPKSLMLLGKALSRTHCDGLYGLFVYHTVLKSRPDVKINQQEHCSYKWVPIPEFEATKLLTAQYEAYRFVSEELKRRIEQNYERFADKS